MCKRASERERVSEYVCVCEIERERERECVCVCVLVFERARDNLPCQ